MPERQPQFAELQRLLQQAGIVDECRLRLIEELQDHYRELRDAAIDAGCTPEHADARALTRLGAVADIASAASQYPDLLSASRRHPRLAGLAHSLVSAVSAPALPVFYCAQHKDCIARWGASVGLAGMITAALLLSLHSMLIAI